MNGKRKDEKRRNILLDDKIYIPYGESYTKDCDMTFFIKSKYPINYDIELLLSSGEMTLKESEINAQNYLLLLDGIPLSFC